MGMIGMQTHQCKSERLDDEHHTETSITNSENLPNLVTQHKSTTTHPIHAITKRCSCRQHRTRSAPFMEAFVCVSVR